MNPIPSLKYLAAKSVINNKLDIQNLPQPCKDYLPLLKIKNYYQQAHASVIFKTDHIFDVVHYCVHNVKTENDRTAFNKDLLSLTWYAIIFNNKRTLEFLLNYKPDYIKINGVTAFLVFVVHNPENIEIAKLLIEKGVNYAPNYPDKKTLLMHASEANNKKILKLLLARANNIHVVCKQNKSALHYAASKNAIEAARYLLKHGAIVDAIDISGNTALCYAAGQSNSIALIHLLLNHKANINHQNNDGETALHIAAKKGHLSNVIFLCEDNADIMLKDKNGNLAIDLAVKNEGCGICNWKKNEKTIDYLLQLHKKEGWLNRLHVVNSLLYTATKTANSLLKFYNFIGAKHSLINGVEFKIVIQEDDVQEIQRYLDVGNSIDKIVDNDNQETILHMAAAANSKKIMTLALKHNPNLQIRNKNGANALILARLNNAYETEELIKEAMKDEILKQFKK